MTPATLVQASMLAIQHLPPGTWLIVRRLAPEASTSEAGSEDELLIVDDIAEIIAN